MKTIIGLGNPGKEYTGTRHNVGRDLALRIGTYFELSDFEENKKYLGLLAKGEIEKEKVTILLPDTFMNKSGKAIAALAPKAKGLIVLQDDTDIPLGSVKIAFGRNSGGHKGIESIMRALKTKDFWRIRIGVQKKKRVDAMDLVLKKFSPEEQKIIKKIEKRILAMFEASLDLQVTTFNVL